MADKTTTIRITDKTKDIIDKIKIHPRETYDDIIKRLVKIVRGTKNG